MLSSVNKIVTGEMRWDVALPCCNDVHCSLVIRLDWRQWAHCTGCLKLNDLVNLNKTAGLLLTSHTAAGGRQLIGWCGGGPPLIGWWGGGLAAHTLPLSLLPRLGLFSVESLLLLLPLCPRPASITSSFPRHWSSHIIGLTGWDSTTEQTQHFPRLSESQSRLGD